MTNGKAPPELEDAISECVRTSIAGDYKLLTIKPTDEQAYSLGNYEQRYHAILLTDSSREQATVKARKKGNEWDVEFVRSTIGN